MRVLFVNHTGIASGAELSLLELVLGMPEEVSSLVACPEGELAETLRSRGVRTSAIPPIEASLRLHPVQTPAGMAQILRTARAVRRAARAHGADIVHANSTRAGLAAILATRAGGPPVVVYVKDCLPAGRAADLTRRVLTHGAALVLANSRYTAASFQRGDRSPRLEVAYSPIDLERFNPERIEREQARGRLGVAPDACLLGVVGQITPWKGQATAIEALARLKERVPAAKLLVVGSVKFRGDATRYDNTAYLRSLHELVGKLGLEDDVTFAGESTDVPEVLRALDVLLAPSWEEPFGRAIVEAMAIGTPVIATSVGGPAELIEDGVNGRLVEPRDPDLWARAIEELLANADLRRDIAERARRTATGFSRELHVERVLRGYHEVLAARAGA